MNFVDLPKTNICVDNQGNFITIVSGKRSGGEKDLIMYEKNVHGLLRMCRAHGGYKSSTHMTFGVCSIQVMFGLITHIQVGQKQISVTAYRFSSTRVIRALTSAMSRTKILIFLEKTMHKYALL